MGTPNSLLPEVIEELKPILRNITGPFAYFPPQDPTDDQNCEGLQPTDAIRVRALELGALVSRVGFFLTEKGELLSAVECDSHLHARRYFPHLHRTELPQISSRQLLQAIRERLGEIERRREVSLASVRERREMIDRMLEEA